MFASSGAYAVDITMEPLDMSPKSILQHDLRPIGAIAVAMAVVIATFLAASTWERVRVRPEARSIEITGSAKKRIVSDLIEWSATIEASAADRVTAYKQLQSGTVKAQQFLDRARREGGRRCSPTAVDVEQLFDTVYEGTGEDRISKQVLAGLHWRASRWSCARATWRWSRRCRARSPSCSSRA
jgi:hypothetical protein